MKTPTGLPWIYSGYGFITADRIAENLGISRESRIRAEAGILHVLHELSDEGHVYYPYEPLVKKCSEVLEVREENIPPALDGVAEQEKVIIDEPGNRKSDIENRKSAAVYLTKFYVSEVGIANRLKTLIAFPKQLRLINIEQAIEWAQKLLKMALSEKQVEALRDSITSKAMVITGGPGTGKTTIINAIIKIYERMGQKVLLAAPTGRAAKRMTEATGHEAKTVHRLLEYSPGSASRDSAGFKKNETNPLDADLIIIDETSMMDTILTYHFLKAVPSKATLIFVGDVDQLPSVGAGNVLKDIIDSGRLPTVRLTDIFRQSRSSMIIVNAHRINSGEMPLFQGGEEYLHDFYFFTIEEPEKVVEKIVYLCKEGVPSRFGFNSVNDIQVLTPMHKGTVGVANLNAELQNR